MNFLRTIAVLLPLASAVPVAYAQARQPDPVVATHVGHLASSDDLLAGPPAREALHRIPWAATASTDSDLAPEAPQAEFVFAAEVPLQAGMFDSPTVWEDEP
ncbi:hypothetical protein HIV01_004815 [Lysobacter arenosi]|uniref:Uncharacterized protein n=1 Tax=Lysobacter arenosi TaxID=2795387 RepID=A0ABX7RCG2_9GAMM|nr:hypothetical protein [Lysobacter arenosi]QSX75848.1 hypothetical protein HIV01_004815 [Lysobacter arenosi]